MSKKDISEEKVKSAFRLREIRENAHLTQEQFSEILGISLSGYKKVESGENQVSLECLKRLHEEMNISSDYILYGKTSGMDETWKAILNCSEADKIFLLGRLMLYFSETKKGTYSVKEKQTDYDKIISQMMKMLERYGEV